CDTETDGGGWLVIQRRASAAVDFFRGWDDYKNGFGDLDGNFWFGLEKVHQLTNQGQYELRFDFEYEGTNYYATYSSFSLDGEPDNYKIRMSGFSGNLRDRINYHNGQPFTTKDRDNDERSGDNCAVERHGAWWYYSWSTVNLNGEWASTRYAKGLFWADVTGYGESVSFSEMKIRERAGK
ncbi:ficolin-1, partial [Aplysia californica]|uniref:Ficolin-1 n=1 Tax=Aplysia californica TaxID=6500 RepID=A0ABM1A8F8_APLCA